MTYERTDEQPSEQAGEQAAEPQKTAESPQKRPLIGVPPTVEELGGLSDQELSGLASGVRGEQNRRHAARVSEEERRARTDKARAASLSLTPDQQRAKTAAALKASIAAKRARKKT